MKYLLLIGIEYKHFKKPAEVSVSIGERFIDVFGLQQDYGQANNAFDTIDKRLFEDAGRLQEFTSDTWKQDTLSIPRLYKIYHIDAKYLSGDLTVNVENDDSNYTNGFMKNSSMIKFFVALIPAQIMSKQGLYLRTMYKLWDGFKKYQKRRNKKKINYDNGHWPLAARAYIEKKSNQFERNQLITNIQSWWIGGSFKAIFPIKTKHGINIIAHEKDEYLGFASHVSAISMLIGSCKPLLNIYNNEN